MERPLTKNIFDLALVMLAIHAFAYGLVFFSFIYDCLLGEDVNAFTNFFYPSSCVTLSGSKLQLFCISWVSVSVNIWIRKARVSFCPQSRRYVGTFSIFLLLKRWPWRVIVVISSYFWLFSRFKICSLKFTITHDTWQKCHFPLRPQ